MTNAHQYLLFFSTNSHLSGREVARWSSLICRNVVGVVIVVLELLHHGQGQAERVGRDWIGVTPSLVWRDIIGVVVVSKHTE